MGRTVTAAGSADDRFASVCESFAGQAGVTTGRMFGADGLKVSNKVFALLVKGRLVVKLPAGRVEAIITGGQGVRFDPGHGRRMKEWISIEPAADADWQALAEEAKTYVGGHRETVPRSRDEFGRSPGS